MIHMTELELLLNSPEYRNANERVAKWKKRLERATREEMQEIQKEKLEFFTTMRREDPELYTAMKIKDKLLGEAIYRKLTGKDVTID
ncbi:TPA: hypothetical protein EYP38_02460 [Candidatus Micrarchaeota archaeon]|nr:hypothetical protein [Candidatus Micrarchaeota archaeon]